MMLESLRGKRMLFAGDSLNGGQYISMVCLLQRVIPDHAKSFVGSESLAIFTAKVSESVKPLLNCYTKRFNLFRFSVDLTKSLNR